MCIEWSAMNFAWEQRHVYSVWWTYLKIYEHYDKSNITWNRTRDATVENKRLTTWAMAWVSYNSNYISTIRGTITFSHNSYNLWDLYLLSFKHNFKILTRKDAHPTNWKPLLQYGTFFRQYSVWKHSGISTIEPISVAAKGGGGADIRGEILRFGCGLPLAYSFPWIISLDFCTPLAMQ